MDVAVSKEETKNVMDKLCVEATEHHELRMALAEDGGGEENVLYPVSAVSPVFLVSPDISDEDQSGGSLSLACFCGVPWWHVTAAVAVPRLHR